MPEAVVALDRSQSFLSFASRELPGERVEWRCGDATKMSFADEGFDVVVSGLVLNFLPSPELMIREMSRVVRRGGTVAAYVWDYGGRMEILRPLLDVAKSMHARAVEADEALRSDNWRPETLARLFASAKLEDITCRGIDLCARFGSFEDYWAPFLGGQGVVGSYILSLTEGERAELRRLLEERMPKEPDGSIALQVRAWGIRGQREGKETA
jgi:SAM-dependent methyltransferase